MRDVTWIGANLRHADRAEIFCQMPDGMNGSSIAAHLFEGMLVDWSWVAALDGQPVCVFGIGPINVATWSGFAFGTHDMPRAIPAMTRHMLAQEQRMIDVGVRRLEVRTISTHDVSHQWLRALGCWFEADLPHYGKNGETFELWSWHLDRKPSRYAKYRTARNVHQSPQAPEAPGATAPGRAQER